MANSKEQHSIESNLSFEECKQILQKYGNNYTDEEIKSIRKFLTRLLFIEKENMQNPKQMNHEQEKLHIVHQSEYRRAS